MTRALACLLVAGCPAPPSPTPPRPVPADATIVHEAPPPHLEATAGPIELTWSPTREGDRIRLDYTVRNQSEQPIVLCDQMRSTKGPVDLAVVQPSSVDGLVAFTAAFVLPIRVIVEHQPRPIAHALAPGESSTGVIYVELPIRPNHPFYVPIYTLPTTIHYAVFEVGYVDGTKPLEREKTYDVPSWAALHEQKIVRGDVQRLP